MIDEREIAVPLACVPGAIPPAERPAHFELLHRLFGSDARERVQAGTGYSFRFLPEMLHDVAAFVANERKCCPFLVFRIDVHADAGPLWLTIEGPEGTRVFLDAELTP